MNYDFDKVIDRTGTNSIKWDCVDGIFHGSGLLPLWVADMDFESPPEVVEALEKRARHGIYGYSTPAADYFTAHIKWFRMRHQWELQLPWIHFSPGIVPALNLLVQTFTTPGDRVIVQQPVYYPFMGAIASNSREILNNPLKNSSGRYSINYDDLERSAADSKATMLILCSPHNPVGRVWTHNELERLGRICLDNNILVVSDEIHCDLTYPGFRHIPFGSISQEFLMNSITCTAPSKTFNLAGLQTASLIIANPELQKKYRGTLESLGMHWPNIFGITAATAAYEYGAPWLDACMEYIRGNLEFLKQFISAALPQIRIIEPEATYLVWLDFRALGMDRDALKRFMREKARVALDDGYIFGSPEGDGFERINIACPRSILEQALQRIEKAIKGGIS